MHKIDTFSQLLGTQKLWEEDLRNNTPNNKELSTIFNLSDLQIIQYKLRYERLRKKRIEDKLNTYENDSLTIKCPVMSHIYRERISYGYRLAEKKAKTIFYLNKRIKFLKETEVAVKENKPLPIPKFTSYDVDFIKENTPIELVMGSPPVKTSIGGKKWWPCPYHNEKTPSFLWNDNPREKYFKCYGCSKSGDIITLHQHINGTSFQETLKLLS